MRKFNCLLAYLQLQRTSPGRQHLLPAISKHNTTLLIITSNKLCKSKFSGFTKGRNQFSLSDKINDICMTLVYCHASSPEYEKLYVERVNG